MLLSPWHQMQHSGFMTHLMRPEQQPRGVPFIMADSLNAIYGLRVDMVGLKQGTYGSESASFVALQIIQPHSSHVHESRYEIRLAPLGEPGTDSLLYFAAYGPSDITSKYLPLRSRLSRPRAANVKLECVDRALKITTRGARPSDEGVPLIFRVGFVIVHSHTIQITTWPSMDTKCRLLAFRRTRVYPLWVDLAVEERASSLVTCTDAHQGCHSTCADFGPEHMSAEMWRDQLMGYWAKECDTAPVESWVRHRVRSGNP